MTFDRGDSCRFINTDSLYRTSVEYSMEYGFVSAQWLDLPYGEIVGVIISDNDENKGFVFYDVAASKLFIRYIPTCEFNLLKPTEDLDATMVSFIRLSLLNNERYLRWL